MEIYPREGNKTLPDSIDYWISDLSHFLLHWFGSRLAPADVIMKEMSQLMVPEECAFVWGEQIHRLETRSQLRVTHRMKTMCGEYRCAAQSLCKGP